MERGKLTLSKAPYNTYSERADTAKRQVCILDALEEEGDPLAILKPPGEVHSVAFSADGARVVALGVAPTFPLTVWDWQSGYVRPAGFLDIRPDKRESPRSIYRL